MEEKTNKNLNSSDWICRHNGWKSACENCIKDIKSKQKTINTLAKKQCYMVNFGDVGEIEKPTENILPLLKKIPEVIRKKMKGRVENETWFALPLKQEIIKDKNGNETPAVKIDGDTFTLNFLNKPIVVPIIWQRDEIAEAQKDRYIGIYCKIAKAYPQLTARNKKA